MTSGKRTSSEAVTPGARRRRRVAPTIDLTATEIDNAAAAGAALPQPAAEPAGASERVPPSAEAASFERKAWDRKTWDRKAWDRKAWGWLRTHLTWPFVAAGGAVVLLVLFTPWLTGAVPIQYADASAMRARVSVLEMQLRDLHNRPAPAVDAKSLDALSQRLAKIEEAVATPRPPLSDPALNDRLAAVETAVKSLGIALTALNRGADDAVANAAEARNHAAAAAKAVTDLQNAARSAAPGIERGDLDALANRIAALERAAKATGAPDAAAHLGLAAASLRDAVRDGEPFIAEFAAIKSLGGDPNTLRLLEPFASTGVPTEPALARELSALLPALLKASGVDAPPAGGFLERLQANAGKLVRIRPAGEAAGQISGDDSAAVVARIEVKAAQADIAGALAEFNKLPAGLRAPADGWIKKAALRQAALDASRKLAADSFRALGK
jgi:hypothetical protein